LDEIGPTLRLGVRFAGPPRLAAPLGSDDSVPLHQPLHPAAWRLLAGAAKRLPHPLIPVGVVVGRMQLPDPLEQPLVLDRPLRATALRRW